MRNLAALVETEEVKASVARVIEETAPGAYSKFATAARQAVELHAPLIEKPLHSKPWEDDEISEKRKQVEEARQSLRANPSRVSRHHLANASKALADMYVEKQTQYYAGIAEKVESASSEGKSKAAFRAINQLTSRKSCAPCGVIHQRTD